MYEERTEAATHNQGEVQHTQKQKTKNKHAQARTTAPAAKTQVQVCYMPRYSKLRKREKHNDNHASER